MARRETPEMFRKAQQRFRAARFRQVQAIVDRLIADHGEIRILDAGGRPEYWNLLSPSSAAKTHITILNYSSELIDYSQSVPDYLTYENSVGDACNMPQYQDREFHLVHSNSVIEHVGSYANMLAFASEVRRVGQAYYVQTPNFWFPIDPHNAFPLMHWLPDTVRIGLQTRWKTGLASKTDFSGALSRLDGCRMISRSMMRGLFPDAHHSAERFGIVLRKSLIASREA